MGIMMLQKWLKNATQAQSAHRDNLGDSGSNGGIMNREGLSPATLQAAPQLAKLLVQEQSAAAKLTAQNVPRAAPPSLGPGGTSLGLSQITPRSPRTDDGNRE